jgi:hypothetical protein
MAEIKIRVIEPGEDGWQIDGDVAEWWAGDDFPKLTLKLMEGTSLTTDMKRLIEQTWQRAYERGLASGKIAKAWEIRRALDCTDD